MSVPADQVFENETVDQQVPDDNASDNTDIQSRDYEGEARHQGWVPQQEWHGDPGKWKPAKQFVEVGEQIAAVANSRKRDLEREIDRLRETNNLLLAKYQADLRKEQQDKERMRGELETKLARAVSNADGQATVQLQKQLNALDQPAQVQAPQISPAELQWRAENPWYGTNPELTETANRIGGQFMVANPGVTPDQIFNHVSQRMSTMYTPTAPRRPASPEGAVPGAPQRRAKGPSYNDLDDAARNMCDQLISQGHMVKVDERGTLVNPTRTATAKGKWVPMTREHYVQTYQSSK